MHFSFLVSSISVVKITTKLRICIFPCSLISEVTLKMTNYRREMHVPLFVSRSSDSEGDLKGTDIFFYLVSHQIFTAAKGALLPATRDTCGSPAAPPSALVVRPSPITTLVFRCQVISGRSADPISPGESPYTRWDKRSSTQYFRVKLPENNFILTSGPAMLSSWSASYAGLVLSIPWQ